MSSENYRLNSVTFGYDDGINITYLIVVNESGHYGWQYRRYEKDANGQDVLVVSGISPYRWTNPRAVLQDIFDNMRFTPGEITPSEMRSTGDES